jgi:Sulfotransferase domain
LNRIIAMWAHQRSLSTAFVRMMIERSDVCVIHEPLVTLLDEGEVPLPDGHGGQIVARCEAQVFDHMRTLARNRPVFFKDTVEHRYAYLFEQPQAVADIVHTFIVREPARTISSMHHMKPGVTCPEIGYEHLFEIFELARRLKGSPPTVVNADRLVNDPRAVVQRYCEQVGLPFIEQALSWQPQDRAEWRRTRKWHVDVIDSAGFAPTHRHYAATVENHPLLKDYFEHHQPFYQQIVRHAI